jgi:virginiamycin B lyase
MRIQGRWLATTAILTLGFAFPQSSPLHAQGAVALAGQVSSQQEGAMEGVLVSARKTGASFTVTVVSDEKGRYAFPAARLEPGHYALTRL